MHMRQEKYDSHSQKHTHAQQQTCIHFILFSGKAVHQDHKSSKCHPDARIRILKQETVRSDQLINVREFMGQCINIHLSVCLEKIDTDKLPEALSGEQGRDHPNHIHQWQE